MMMRRAGLVLLVAMGWAVAGCASTPERAEEQQQEENLAPGIWDVHQGASITFEDLLERLGDATFVVVGETHGVSWHHEVQYEIYQGLSVERPGEVALGMEMIEGRFQSAVDDYLAGEIDEAQMLTEVEWYDRWRVDDGHYAPMWQLARELEQPVVALNARRELVRVVGEVGIDQVGAREQELLPELDRDDRAYREHLRQSFALHGHTADREAELDKFFEAQLVWDETMAERAWSFIDGGGAAQMVLLTGRGHMERGFGVPPRLVRRGAAAEDVVTVVPVSTRGSRAAAMDSYRRLLFLQEEGIADYVWIQE